MTAAHARRLRVYALASDSGGTTQPYLLLDADGAEIESPRGRRRSTTFDELGFRVLDGTIFTIPVAPRWSIRPDLATASLALTVDEHVLVQVPIGSLPKEWVDCALDVGMVTVLAGVGLNLDADHPAQAIYPASENGLVCGAVVLVDWDG